MPAFVKQQLLFSHVRRPGQATVGGKRLSTLVLWALATALG